MRRPLIERVRNLLWRTALGPAIVIWLFGYLLVDIVNALTGKTPPGASLLISVPMFVLGVCQTEALDKLRHTLRRAHFAVRALAVSVAAVAAASIQALFDVYWTRYLSLTLAPQWQGWALPVNQSRLGQSAIIYLWTFCLALALLWAARASRASHVNAARAAHAEAAAAKAQSAALRLQLNPHFLFNTMNSISSLVALDRKEEAEGMIGRLCEFLRASLNADPMEDVPLSQEIDAIDAYLSIEATRFGDRLHIDIDVAADIAEAPVPNFILQPLVENAIKHGVSAVKGRSRLAIHAAREGDELVMTVVNEADEAGDAGAADTKGTGIGLSNSRQRLSNRYGTRARLMTEPIVGGYRAQVRLPLAV
jgi:two-component system LytT family sensor kinase